MTSSKTPLTIQSFTILPILLPAIPSLPKQQPTHYLYIRPDAPKIPTPTTPRTLFLANIPVTTTETHLKHLFSTQLSAGRVEKVEFPHSTGYNAQPSANSNEAAKQSRKRKRGPDIPALEAALLNTTLPATWPSEIHNSGSTALVVFADKASAELTMKVVKKAAKSGTKVLWADGLDTSKLPTLGSKRYLHHQRATYPDKSVLLKGANRYMTLFQQLENARKAEGRKLETKVDEDGFVTVVRGPKPVKAGQVRKDEEGKVEEKKKGKGVGLEDFYRFQMREKRKEREGELRREFERDRKKVEEMRERRGRPRPED
jgi:ribosomal RNA-processing protein 7